MLIEAFITLVTTIVNALLSLLPSWSPIDLDGLIDDLNSGPAGSVFGGLAWANWYLPIEEMIAAGLLLLSIKMASHIVKLVIWLLQLFHIAGGSSS